MSIGDTIVLSKANDDSAISSYLLYTFSMRVSIKLDSITASLVSGCARKPICKNSGIRAQQLKEHICSGGKIQFSGGSDK